MLSTFRSFKTLLWISILLGTDLCENKLLSNSKCLQSLAARNSNDLSLTKHFIIILQNLLALSLLNQSDLIKFKEHLQLGQITNPIYQERSAVDPLTLLYSDEIERILIERTSLSIEELLLWVEKKIDENNPLGYPIDFQLVRTISKEEYYESLK